MLVVCLHCRPWPVQADVLTPDSLQFTQGQFSPKLTHILQ